MTLRKIFPESTKLTLLILLVPAFIVLIIATTLLTCNRNQSCGENAWNEQIWGTRSSSVSTQFCEQDSNSTLLLEEQNSLSNFTIVYFGLVIFGLSLHDFKNLAKLKQNERLLRSHLTSFPFGSLIHSLSLIYLGIGSFLFHAQGSNITQDHDRAGILVHLVLLNLQAFFLFLPLNSPYVRIFRALGYMTGCLLSLTLINLSLHEGTNPSLAYYLSLSLLLVGLIFVNAVRRRIRNLRPFKFKQFKLLSGSLLLFTLGLFVQEDLLPNATNCSTPTSAFQFHALWHFLAGFGLFTVYLFFRSDHQAKLTEADELIFDCFEPESSHEKPDQNQNLNLEAGLTVTDDLKNLNLK